MKIINKTLIFAFLLIIILNFASAGIACCEKTAYGAWCLNDEEQKCDNTFRVAPTSCESTSYCKLGCCFDSHEGICMENTAQRVCEEQGGAWNENADCSIRQCSLGCCVLGDQAALATLTRCKSLSGVYGLKTDFRAEITDELSCIDAANEEDKGACVYDSGTGTATCSFTTRGECSAPDATLAEANSTDAFTIEKAFYDGVLCSAEELGTDCGPSTKTSLIEGKDEVYFLDSCGNQANIYDASRYNDKLYWKYVSTKAESCGYGESNAGSKSCGNCDYFLGSIGRKAGILNQPTYGDYVCISLDCDDGHEHGESWCVSDSEKNKPGSRYFKKVCLFNEVLVEPCADFRNEICVESGESFVEARCTINRWQDCITQIEKEDCENEDLRDCSWSDEGYYLENGVLKKSAGKKTANKSICVPKYAPGFQFWSSSSSTSSSNSSSVTGKAINGYATENQSASFSAGSSSFNAGASSFGTGAVSTSQSTVTGEAICKIANAQVKIEYEKKYENVFNPLDWKAEWKCVKNCEYEGKAGRQKFVDSLNSICTSLGDCGGDANWVGETTDEGYAAYYQNKRFAGGGGSDKLTKETTTATTSSTSDSTSKTKEVVDVASTAAGALSKTSSTGKVIIDFIKSFKIDTTKE